MMKMIILKSEPKHNDRENTDDDRRDIWFRYIMNNMHTERERDRENTDDDGKYCSDT